MVIRSIISAIVLGMFFVAYNASFFIIKFGFIPYVRNGACFWSSYAFMVLAFIVAGISFLVTLLMKTEPKDAFLRFPIFAHTIAFFVFELILTTVFMVVDSFKWINRVVDLWFVSIPVQLFVFAIYIAIFISSFFVKGHIKNVDNKVKDKTNFIKLLKVDVDVIAEGAADSEVREAYMSLSEQVRYSDPMSHESLFELEKQILECLEFSKRCVEQGNAEGALQNCEIASRLLFERNEKTKALK
jgi:hypothetical protein